MSQETKTVQGQKEKKVGQAHLRLYFHFPRVFRPFYFSPFLFLCLVVYGEQEIGMPWYDSQESGIGIWSFKRG